MSKEAAEAKAKKPPIFSGVIEYFPRVIEALACLSQAGAGKHGHDCERRGVINSDYSLRTWDDAAGRHQLEYAKGNLVDGEMGSLHRINEIWCKMAAAEKFLQEIEYEEITREAMDTNFWQVGRYD